MNQSKDKDKHLSCNVCHNEIPLSAALTPEGVDYVHHFCSKDCFEKWRKHQKEESSK